MTIEPKWARALGRLIPRRYRDDVVADLADEYRQRLAHRQPPSRAALWLAAEIVRSARASRRGDPERASRGDTMLATLSQDVRYALRYFRRRPGFTAVTLMTLTLGIGVNLATFAVVHATLLRPLPFPNPDAVVRIWEEDLDDDTQPLNPFNFVTMQAATRDAFTHFGAWRCWTRITLTGAGAPVIVPTCDATPALFGVVGVPPVAGRVLTEDDVAQRAKVVVISHRLWQSKFQGSSDAVGSPAMLDGVPWTIVGVMPEGVAMPDTDVWRPLAITPEMLAQRNSWYLNAAARLRPGVSLDQADAAVKAAMAAIPRENGDERSAAVVDYRASTVNFISRQLLFTQGVTALVLAIACANLANLFLAAFSARRQELAIRLAIGAGRWRIVRQLAVEGLVIAAAGSVIAIGAAQWIVPAVVASYPGALPRRAEVSIRAVEWLFAIGIAAVTTLASTIMPAMIAAGADVGSGVRAHARETAGATARWMRKSLLVAEVAIALMLLTGAGLLIRSLARLTDHPLGFSPDGVLTTEVALPSARYATPESRVTFFTTLFERLNARSSIRIASGSNIIPFDLSDTAIALQGELRQGKPSFVSISLRVITPDYFDVMQIPLKQGRYLQWSDRDGAAPVTVVNEAFVKRYAADMPVWTVRARRAPDAPWVNIVGVVGDLRPAYERDARPEMYFLLSEFAPSLMRLTMRPSARDASIAADVRDAITSLDPDLAIGAIQPYDALMNRSVSQRRFDRGILTALASLATLLAAVGIYGVMSHMVTIRRREAGVRLALGARPDQVVALVVRQGLAPVVAGLAVGLAGAWLLASLLESQLHQIAPRDPWTLLTSTALFFAIGVLACWIPARRTSRVDPVSVLRAD